ncbi:NAD-dependent protein deacetylase, SIR2 family [Raineyella antarctica]|uniref:protein acetyllysine N-acetyltransferase n=1 Tax=Raineyella antarctica TaxID=1577474 RepID=A0A1G6H751_9ACTN|nr:NAD-dependent protein deacetylase [Raineyella antarctica]SDB90097.1 NAD-dependent protein deacetylase, SIR2 family [Raineyella antarctica]
MHEHVASLLATRRWLVLTGAGMSTASGIPDYRDPDGTRRIQPMRIDEFRTSAEARRRYWARSYVGWQNLRRATPNPAHQAVTALQRLGVAGPVITQNVDGLHQAAGSEAVTELHGSLARVVCEACGDVSPRQDLDARMAAANPGFVGVGSQIRPDGDAVLSTLQVDTFRAPLCRTCSADRLRPDVVFFGDMVPRERVAHCFDLVERAEGLLVLGSSLQVMSGLRFVRRAAKRDLPIVVLTRGRTRGDELATLKWEVALEEGLPALADTLTNSDSTTISSLTCR